MRNVLFSLALLVAMSATPPTQAQEAQDVRSLIRETYRADPDRFIWKQMNGPDGRGFRVVLVHEGRRYTIDHDWWVPGIQIWERRDGTGTPQSSVAFSDGNSDGVVDFGTDGEDRIFSSAEHSITNIEEGVEHQPYWQRRYDRALNALAAALRE